MAFTCLNCIRECPPGFSFCGRKDNSGQLVQKSIFCAALVDRLFEKPIFYFGPDIPILSLGSWGCNFRCRGCQNASLSWTTTGSGLGSLTLDPGAIVRLTVENACRGIAFTYNEPAVHLEALEEIAAECRSAGLITILVTNSTLTGTSARRIAPFIHAVAADIKSFEDGFYQEYCGSGAIRDVATRVRDCILEFCRMGCHVEIRTNIIPGANDGDKNLNAIAEWIQAQLGPDTPWHLTRFFPAHELHGLPRTPTAVLLRAQRIGIASGLNRVHVHYAKGCDCARETALIRTDAAGVSRVTKSCCG